MSNRISKKDLENVVSRINHIAGTPQEPYSMVEGKYKPNAGCYHLSGAYGGYSLVQMSSRDGCSGVRNVLNTGYVPKRELYDAMQAYISGLIDCADRGIAK